MTRRGWALGLVVVAGLLAVGVLAGEPRRSGPPLDPRSTDPDGTRALVAVLRDLGAVVTLDRRGPRPGGDVDQVVLVLRDDLSTDERSTLLGWVEDGGTLVVADATSSLHPGRTAGGGAGPLAPGRCSVEALAGVGTIDAGERPPLLAAPPGTAACFTDGERAHVVVSTLGRGRVVAVAAPTVFTNEHLPRADNARLAASLLAPRDGTRVVVVERARPGAGAGDESLAGLVPDGVWAGLAQAVLAFVVLVLARGRRLGRPVHEPQVTTLPGSGLVVGVGHLMARAGHRQEAAGVLRAGVRAEAAGALGLGPDAGPAVVADAAVARTGLARDDVQRALGDGAVADDRELVAVARAVVALRDALGPGALGAGAGGGVVRDHDDEVEVPDGGG